MSAKRVRKTNIQPRKARWSTQAQPEPAAGGDGGAGGAPAGGAPAGGETGTPAAGAAEKQLSQSEVNAIVTREKAAAKAAADKAFAEALGVPLEEAQVIIKKHSEAAEAEKSEAQRARDAADAEAAKSKTEQATAKLEAHNTRADRALMTAKISLPEDDTAADAALARVRGLLTVQVGATPEEIKADVAEVKKLYPALFTGATAPGGTPGSDPGTPGGGGTGAGGKTGIQAGMDRAAAEYKQREDNRPLPAGQTRTKT